MDTTPSDPSDPSAPSDLSGPALVRHVARLARLSVDDEQTRSLAASFEGILQDFARLADAPLEEDDEAPGTTGDDAEEHVSTPRDDVEEPSLSVDIALRNAPQRAEDFYVVPKTIVRES